MMRFIYFILFALSFSMFTSCAINNNMMFKAPIGEAATLDSLPIRPTEEYRIEIDDKIVFSLSTNNGTKLIENLAISTSTVGGGGQSPEFTVRLDGTVELPVFGSVKFQGLTIKEAEDYLEKLFAPTYTKPYVQVRVTNKRVIVFPGGGGDARVILLQNSNTTLMEVIASAGGINERGRANRVKLIRKEGDVRKMYIIDLSTTDGLKYADVVVQGNDYIYIEPRPRVISETLKEIAPILSLVSTFILIVSLFTLQK